MLVIGILFLLACWAAMAIGGIIEMERKSHDEAKVKTDEERREEERLDRLLAAMDKDTYKGGYDDITW